MEQPPNRIAELRKAKKWSLSDLEERSGVSRNSINLIERGEAELTLEKMRAIGRSLGVRPSALLLEQDVEIRLSDDLAPLLEVLRSIPNENRQSVARAAQSVVSLARTLVAQNGAAAFEGDAVQLMKLSELWNGMHEEQRSRALDLLTATGFSEPSQHYRRR